MIDTTCEGTIQKEKLTAIEVYKSARSELRGVKGGFIVLSVLCFPFGALCLSRAGNFTVIFVGTFLIMLGLALIVGSFRVASLLKKVENLQFDLTLEECSSINQEQNPISYIGIPSKINNEEKLGILIYVLRVFNSDKVIKTFSTEKYELEIDDFIEKDGSVFVTACNDIVAIKDKFLKENFSDEEISKMYESEKKVRRCHTIVFAQWLIPLVMLILYCTSDFLYNKSDIVIVLYFFICLVSLVVMLVTIFKTQKAYDSTREAYFGKYENNKSVISMVLHIFVNLGIMIVGALIM